MKVLRAQIVLGSRDSGPWSSDSNLHAQSWSHSAQVNGVFQRNPQ